MLERRNKGDSELNKWEEITDNLRKAFEGSDAPYIDDICKLSKSGYAAAHISWWTDGIFGILEELINAGYAKPEKIDYLLGAIALMEANADMRGDKK